MPTTEQLRNRLTNKLKELFQLDQPDLDFGFYKIMHAKSEQVLNFLENDLLKIIEDAFGQTDEAKKVELKAVYEKELETAKKYGAPDPENTDAVREARARFEALSDNANAEGDVYDHLYRFFERYYHNGDFISRRYFTRETSGKAAPFAIPYNGEEVKLHWANADQYYIKTAEYFNNFTFDLRQAKEVQDLNKRDQIDIKIDDNPEPLRVHFRIEEAAEGEHGDIKASEATKRYFIIHKKNPVELNTEGELVVHFEYRPDTEKTGQENTWRGKRNAESVKTIFDAIKKIANAKEYQKLLETPAPTDKDNSRTLLAKYINKYTARNTYDYFIHKDLGGFLRREMDFYIKNEVMRIDDIESADIPEVETYLGKLRVLRKIAGKLIAFLAQLEDFQKKLWLKKKFVVETNYCITIDRVPEELYPEIVDNTAQHDEWVKLFSIDEIKHDLPNPSYSKTLTVEFLKANNKLLLDTKFFDEPFKGRLFSSIENFDDQCNGLLIHSENFQALNLFKERYREQVKCIHIDPPYNTATSGFLYKNAYQHSSWIALMENRLSISLSLLSNDASYMCHIDENEYENLFMLFECSEIPNAGTVVWDKRNPMNAGRGVATQHEYIIWRTKQKGPIYLRNKTILLMLAKAAGLIERAGGVTDTVKRNFISWINSNKELTGGEKAYRYIDDDGLIYQSVSLRAPEPRQDSKFHQPLIHPVIKKPCAIPPNGFSRTPETLQDMINRGEILFGPDETTQPRQKVLLTKSTKRQISSLIQDAKKGKAYTDALGVTFPYCHPVSLYAVLLGTVNYDHGDAFLDYFAGSGTTGHAVINLNREDGGKRKYILVEIGDYFDTVLKPRITKVVYSDDWKDGKPKARDTGISHCFKYIRLESYEDTLNNLRFEENPIRNTAVAADTGLKEDYMLHYLLDVETRGSQSILNIDAFTNPESYQLKIKRPGSDENTICNVDLLETFNYLIGLRVTHIATPQIFYAKFKRETDSELPDDQHTRLVIDGRIKQDESGPWWFRKVEGWVPADPNQPNNGKKEKVLIVWRKLTGNLEKDNLMLDEWFQKNRISTRDFEFDTIYVNGSNNLPNLKLEGENWKVRLIEEDFMRLMWDVENV
ncbi:site-specific DNA-methyltransferase [Thermodesulfobacteriota bacterium]